MSPKVPDLPEAHVFSHEAMHTTFRLRICEADAAVARGMARECFDQLEFLETRLSRFIEGSDVSRINRMAAGETLYISEACHRCLVSALQAYQATGGLFDITLGRRIEHRKSGAAGPPPPLTGTLVVHPDVPAVTCGEPGREIDLGGIGKGFALDELHRLLLDWGCEGALLSAGASSMLAFGREAWPVDLASDEEVLRVELRDGALSASGTGVQGAHILHPAGDEAMPAFPVMRIWTTAPNAALAEVWSTALMLLAVEEIPEFLEGESAVTSVFADRGRGVERVLGRSFSRSMPPRA